jgi:2-phospho-L-lactate guanylyltransferase
MTISAFIPVKKFNDSKNRLSQILSPNQRANFSKLMAHQTIEILQNSNICNSITLVTNDPDLDVEGTNIFFTTSSLNYALQEAIDASTLAGSILIIHADLPQINEKDLKNLVNSYDLKSITIVPDIDEIGTNCILYNETMKFNLRFGINSYELFIAEFERHDYNWNNLNIKSLQQDLDSEDDYFKLKNYVRGSASWRLIE